ncbi:DASH family cryptochrome [Maribacter sp. 2-571]|uniref:DASH family cryptochrome n=1 Tax=Maribacter sp. 2-571 TaxID=3417569 RepID=UPI003D33F7D0
MKKNVLLWFKNDLRLHDNESLVKAIATGATILPVYIFDTERYRKLPLGLPKTDLVRLHFLKQCVSNLRENLKGIGGNLMILTGRPEIIIPKLIKEYNCHTVFAEQEFATEELVQIRQIGKEVEASCTFDFAWGRTLYHLKDIPYAINDIPLTSKAYRINTTKNAVVRGTFRKPKKMSCIALEPRAWSTLPDDKRLGFREGINFTETYVPGGETAALERLEFYTFKSEQLTGYRWSRNRSLGMEYSSKFSPYLALGCLSARTIYETVKRYEAEVKKNQSTWWLIFELIWRDYFTFKLMRFQNKVYHTQGYTDKTYNFKNSVELFHRWCAGETGIPFVDAHMRQLNATGFMSNRGRVNCSSFLVYDYQIDWTWGAAYFESKLIDYDVASNWMNWHAQAYQIWYTNPVNQANKYKAHEFIRKWVPELRHTNDREVLIPWEYDIEGYPSPNTIFKKWTRAITKIKKEHDDR